MPDNINDVGVSMTKMTSFFVAEDRFSLGGESSIVELLALSERLESISGRPIRKKLCERGLFTYKRL
jgi:hypothetical protein